ncbi:sodium:proton antiporter [Pseudoclavibacter sp. RFBJ3]|uniref:dicarboxylate/amino acid:cation symporter n=1 Tax=unclassified Pseudoclavibacter TaxID=2615177 RepID=UPI000CE7CCE8|nr:MULTISPECIES: dicarboxylate/amino acid:cation symporter [unclassified Pseudoclavibacter]MBF4551070.1 dicarboxylate/amino acid:cation symporter [Pseudoclavibacter sp. VKM Ac-2888]PPF36132.1 sodium:proton antiporter [Pseudoclavibacter sp. AY1H1]PPF73441.1 sodium:proton antiporter [Pseudoclavibacter sp. Z016]PPF81475.1 sodium:proton antiporter [Pseudoclavibacter sp. RFBJ5]PPF90806.1 sodium:proton antiporter [Pseudoclavibacter sp. RFBJ3]
MSANTPGTPTSEVASNATGAEDTPRPKSRARKLLTSFGFQILAALVLGVVLGLVARNLGDDAEGNPNGLAATLDTIGSSYVTILTAAVVPLILTAVISSIAQLRLVTNAARLAGQTLLWFGITALIAVTIGITLGVTIQPGNRVDQSQLETGEPSSVGTWWNFLTGLVPQNFLGMGVRSRVDAETGDVTSTIAFNVLQVIVIAVVIGIAALRLGKRAEPFLEFTASALAVIQKVLWWIIRIAPLGTLGLIASAVVDYGWEKLTSLAWFAIAIYVGLALVLFVVYPILVKAHGLSVGRFFSGVWPAVQLAFVSRSSIGTLPLTQRVTERNLGVPREYASFAVPFGATTKMDGCAAIYPAIAAIFVAQFFGIELSIMQYILIVVVSVVGSAATAGTTGATVMLTLTLSTLGLPLEGVGLLLAIDPILDMGRTATNVAGQALVPMIVAKREGILNEKLYNAPRGDVAFSDETDEEVEETIKRSTASTSDREQDEFEGATLQDAERRS